MSVAPDLLLKPAPEVRPKASAAKAPAKPAEPAKNEASSFAQVYAKERQAKSVERSEAAAKPNREKTSESECEADPGTMATAGEPQVADSGNPLPTDPVQPDLVLDPMLLMAMAGQQLPIEEQIAARAEGEGEQVLPGVLGSLNSSGPAAINIAGHDPELDALSELPGVKMVLELGAKAQAAAQQQAVPNVAPNAAATQTALSAGQHFATAMAAFADQAALTDEGEAPVELPFAELATESLDALKDTASANDVRTDNLAGKPNVLNQVVAQTPRAALVPGQPIPMQQSGWTEAVVDRVMWLSSQNLKSAEIQLDPADLGRLEVRISLQQDQAQVTFASPNAGVRDALEGQMHRLREMFTQQGMNTLDVNVSDQSLNRGWQGQGGGDGQGRGGSRGDLLGGAEDDLPLATSEVRGAALAGGRGLVDYYA